MMKKIICMAMAVLMMVMGAGSAMADGLGYQLFCYLIDVSNNKLSVLTDQEQEFEFEIDHQLRIASHSGRLNLDDVALLSYSGGLNEDTVAQPGVTVRMVTVLSTFTGTIENIDGDIYAIREMSDEGMVGSLYLFDATSCDVHAGEAGANTGDEVEVAFEGTRDMLAPNQQQNLSYVHITVYTQMDGDFEADEAELLE